MLCPKCGNPLSRTEIGAVAGDVCGGCEGVWLAYESIAAYLKAHLEAQGLPSKTIGLLETPPVPTEHECPSCRGRKLRRVRLRGIEVEQCRDCRGTFFDRGELEMIARRLGKAARDTRALDASRNASVHRNGSMKDIEHAIGDAIEAALWGFGLDV
jgi:Zn-finger nucleic acid-binding protein